MNIVEYAMPFPDTLPLRAFCKTLPQAVAEFWSRTLEARFPVFRVLDWMLPGYFLL
jgi:hypothetical protein